MTVVLTLTHPLPPSLSRGDQNFIFDPEASRDRLEGAGFEIKDVMAGIPDEELDPFLVKQHSHGMLLVQKHSTRSCPHDLFLLLIVSEIIESGETCRAAFEKFVHGS